VQQIQVADRPSCTSAIYRGVNLERSRQLPDGGQCDSIFQGETIPVDASRVVCEHNFRAMNVFISYAQADEQWANVLRAGLAQAGLEVSDPAGEMCAGENLHLEIGKALKRADAMVVVLSPDSAASRSVRAEIEYALSSAQFRDRLIPLLVRPTEDLPWILRKQQFIRATKDVAKTVREVAAALNRSGAAVAR
jgi:hypothetical protein